MTYCFFIVRHPCLGGGINVSKNRQERGDESSFVISEEGLLKRGTVICPEGGNILVAMANVISS